MDTYKCNFDKCDFKTQDIKSIMQHIEFEHDPDTIKKCFMPGCRSKFIKMHGFKKHVINEHLDETKRFKLKCGLSKNCNIIVDSVVDLSKHYCDHLGDVGFDKTKFECFFKNCSFKFTNASLKNFKRSFQTHLLLAHRLKFDNDIKQDVLVTTPHKQNSKEPNDSFVDLLLSMDDSSYDSQFAGSSTDQSNRPSTSHCDDNDDESEASEPDMDVVFIKEECIYNSEDYNCLDYTKQMKDEYKQTFMKYNQKYAIGKAQFDEIFVDLMGIVGKGNKYIQQVVLNYYSQEAKELVPAFKTYFENIQEFDSEVLKAVVDSE